MTTENLQKTDQKLKIQPKNMFVLKKNVKTRPPQNFPEITLQYIFIIYSKVL